MNHYMVLKKKDFNAFIEKLSKKMKVAAPVRKGVKNFAFEEVTRGDAISRVSLPTILPPKKYFMPQRETIQTFDRAVPRWNSVVSENDAIVIFGVHTCDLSGIQFLNAVMGTPPKDANYLARKANITVIGLECNDYCDAYASCKAMKTHLPSGGYDLFFTDIGDAFMVQTGSAAGETLAQETGFFTTADTGEQKKLKDIRTQKEKIFKDEISVKHADLRTVFEKTVQSEVWEDIGSRCVACGNCTNVCPTCYCFDIQDEIDLNLRTGRRVRVWDGCQNEEFAKVAGGENFRRKRGQRQRHRYMRKFAYPMEKYGTYACTGCGRCTRTCMAKISLKETIHALGEEAKS